MPNHNHTPITTQTLAMSPRLWWIGSAFFLLLNLTVFFYASLSLPFYPIEGDDVMGILQRSLHLAECPTQDCVAMEDVLQQVNEPTSDPQVQAEKGVSKAFMFPHYTPLQSVIITALHGVGMDWWRAFQLTHLLALLLFTWGLFHFLRAQWGAGVAMIAPIPIALMLGTTLPSLMGTVASTAVFGLFFYGLARLLEQGKAVGWHLPLLCWLMCLLHMPVGMVLSAILMASYLFINPINLSKTTLYTLATATLAPLLVVLTPRLLDRPITGASIPSLPVTHPLFMSKVMENLQGAISVIRDWMAHFVVGKWGLLALLILLLWLLPRHRLRSLAVLFFITGAALSTLMVVYDGYATFVFPRFFAPIAIWLIGGLCYLALVGYNRFRATTPQPNRPLKAAGLLLALACTAGLLHATYLGISYQSTIFDMKAKRYNYLFEPKQVAQVTADTQQACGRIYYDNLLVMGSSMLHGAEDCGVLAAYLHRSEDMKHTYLERLSQVTHFIRLNPIAKNGQNGLKITTHPIIIEPSKANHSERVYLSIQSRSGESRVSVWPEGSPDKKRDHLVHSEQPTHLEISQADWAQGKRWMLHSTEAGNTLVGVRAGNPGALRWPWGQGILIESPSYNTKDTTPIRYTFDPELLVHNQKATQVEVFNDEGYTYAGRLSWHKQP
ncbi:hypothetical protein [Magnetococcus sp. PR-3]|uniref:hypothetical protein n=1 Tax=Magnetococcus sp. PR-3 TaxID=3120355 RepID=UPI002FCE3CFD